MSILPTTRRPPNHLIEPKVQFRDSPQFIPTQHQEHHADASALFSSDLSQPHLPSAPGSNTAGRLGWILRIRHFTWAFFTMTMATGGVANVINAVPYRFRGLYTIGCIFMILNIALFLLNVLLISSRFYLYPYTSRASLLHPTESLFVPTSLVSIGTILININQYGLSKSGHWLNITALGLFWMYAALAFLLSFGTYLMMWSTQTFTIASMTPAWIFPAYPLLLVGPNAGALASKLSAAQSLPTIIGGITLQSLGFLVAFLMYAAYIYRLMTQKLPEESSRPSMFISVGPAGFTATALMTVAKDMKRTFPAQFMGNGEMAAMISRILANWIGVCLWSLTLWFFFISLGSHYFCFNARHLKFTITWWSFVFPNTALVTATFAVGDAFDSKSIKIIGCVLTCILICVWCFVFGMMVHAILVGDILMPQKGEDRDEGGWKEEEATMRFGGATRREARKRIKEKS